jgi:hypothetical protein
MGLAYRVVSLSIGADYCACVLHARLMAGNARSNTGVGVLKSAYGTLLAIASISHWHRAELSPPEAQFFTYLALTAAV